MDVSRHNGEVTEISEKLEKSLSMETDDKMELYHRFVQDGKDVARKGDIHKALECFKLAYNIHQSQKLESRIKKIEELLAQNDSEEEDEEFVDVDNSGFMLFKELHDKLYDYQRDGVVFLYSLYRDGQKGGILADDMGLGKTIQVISFLSGMYDNELVKHTLLIMPTSLITNWTKEFAKWTPGMRVKEFHGASKGERTRSLEKVQRRGGVVITTYTMLINNWQQLASYHGKEFTWDYMILDEAHKIKSTTTKTAKSAYAIPSRNRVLLTGTPVQNNLREMWALFDFACQGTLLGTAKTFKTEYENPITRAREKDATPGEKALGSRMSENLMAIIKPHFLRRTKSEVQKNKKNGTPVKEDLSHNKEKQVQSHKISSEMTAPTLTRKNDLIVWTYLSAVQEDIYRQFISLDHIKELLLTTRSPLAELNILKKLCDHPRLLSAGAITKLGLEESPAEGQQSDDADSHSIDNVPDNTLISESGKLVFLFALLERLRQEGHRTLVFAHFRKVLDIIERILGNRGFKVLRLDGTITQIAERERLISLFQTDERYSVFLLTTQVGGVGITLTAANRVVIYDPSWNPATDAQAVDRAYRIGQTENVVIYRLITCGTVEEKIYRRQVFKDSLIRQNTGDKKNPFRYFSKQELKELFTLGDTRSSSTQLQLQAMHSRHRRTDPQLDEHIAHLHAMEMCGISDHDLMFSLDVNHDEAPEDQEEHRYIEGRVQKAHELVKAESELQMQLTESIASSTEPAWLKQPMDSSGNRERSREKQPRNLRPSSSYPQHDMNGSPAVVDLDNTDSDKDNGQQNQNDQVIDLTTHEDTREEQSSEDVSKDELERPNMEPPKPYSVKHERSYLEAVEITEVSVVASDAGDASVQGLMDCSVMVEDDVASVQELTDCSVTAEDGVASVQELMDRSVMAEDGVASVQELMDRSVTAEDGVASVQELMDRSAGVEAAGDSSLSYITAVDESEQQLNRTSHSGYRGSNVNISPPLITPLQNKRLSILQSKLSFKGDSSRVSTSIESFEGNFNLQLEDSDMISDHDIQDDQETEAKERELLSQLQLEGSFNVNKSLSKSLNNCEASEVNESMNESIIVTRKKRAAVIYDSEEDGNDDDDVRQQMKKSQLDGSFQVLGASTPKSAPSGSTPLRVRRSVGGNTSVASSRSLLQSIIADLDKPIQDEGDDDGDTSERHSEEEEEELDEEEEDIIGLSYNDNELKLEETARETLNTDDDEEEIEKEWDDEKEQVEEEEEDIIGLTCGDELQLEETTGETLNTEGEEEVDEEEELSNSLELSSSEPEMASTERMEQFTADITVTSENYESLVSRGRECFSKGQLDDALAFFLRAIDIQPGDPEVQLMTIQLYRQLTQRR